MIYSNLIVAAVLGLYRASAQSQSCTPVESITCVPAQSTPTLDGNTDEWSSVEVTEAPLTAALTAVPYSHGNGNVKIQCAYDQDKVYFVFQIPGPYSFDTVDNHLCASVSTMFKMGEDATLYNMGGCPLAAADCPADSSACDDYLVDIGGHWELKTTEQGVYYGTNTDTGDDLIANKDDEYAVSPFCRMDDDDGMASNEWEGAWVYVNGTSPDEVGSYIFEMSRSLSTSSNESDAQLEVGKATDFGFSYWVSFVIQTLFISCAFYHSVQILTSCDIPSSNFTQDPTETETGWTDAGHYVTGCSVDWISLRFEDEKPDELTPDTADGGESTGDAVSISGVYALVASFLALVVFV